MESVDQQFSLVLEAMQSGDRGLAIRMLFDLLAAKEDHLDGNYLLGTLLAESGNLDGALRFLARASEISPRSARIWNNIATVHRISGRPEDSIRCYVKALGLEPDQREAGENLGSLLDRLGSSPPGVARTLLGAAWVAVGQYRALAGNPSGALDAYRAAQGLLPSGSTDLEFRIAALSGKPLPKYAPQDVARMFDGYAEMFDEHLEGHLDYRVPATMAGYVAELAGAGHTFRRTLDLGCGTGLSGLAFRTMSGYLAGIDLSQEMLRKADARKVYDEVQCVDIHDYLRTEGQAFDLVVAADLMPYLGRLDELLGLLRQRTEADGQVWFSVETHPGMEDFVVGLEGRYAQSTSYVRRVATEQGFRVVFEREVPLRKQADGYCPGAVFGLVRLAG